VRLRGWAAGRPGRGVHHPGQLPPNKSFKPKPLRYANHMAGKACHVLRSTTRLGLTLVLGLMKSFLLLLILLVVSACQDHAAGQSADGSKALAPEATITQLAGWTTQQQTADPASFISMSQADRSVVSVTNDGPLRQIEIHGADS